MNGGPGCSSLNGLFTENGPLRPNMNGGLDYANLAWTQYANMLYLETPAGVGFSYSNDPLDYITDDEKTARDNYVFLQSFMETYTNFKGRELWITGESYAGVYIPTLVNLILSNKTSPLYSQLKGFMAGNPVFNCDHLNRGVEEMNVFYYHGLISYSHYARWMQLDCNNKDIDPVCDGILLEAVSQVGLISQQLVVTPQSPLAKNFPSLDPDCLYQDFCTGNGTLQFSVHTPEGCEPMGGLVEKYLNLKSVQSAIAANPTKWTTCSHKIIYAPSGKNMIPLYANFPKLKPGVEILVYSGDVDVATVPFPRTQQCLATLKDTQTKTWGPWYVNGATAGYWEQFSTFTYATIKGAGHEAPEYQPLSALNMFSSFLLNGVMPSS